MNSGLVINFLSLQLELKLAGLQEQHSVKVRERDTLQGKSEEIAVKLRRAEALTSSLGDEQACTRVYPTTKLVMLVSMKTLQ